VIKQYALPANVTNVNLDQLTFDLGTRKISITTSMTLRLPVPRPGNEFEVVTANVTQPIVSIPAAQ
jgi:hypothetical protein